MEKFSLPINYTKPIQTIMRARHSVRTYQPFLVPKDDKAVLVETMRTVSEDGQRFA